jgi:hypothetical protein
MTFADVKRANSDTSKHGTYDGTLSWERLQNLGRGRFLLIPSLGVIAPIGRDEPLGIIEFYVCPYRSQMIPGLEVQHPFRGKLGETIAFKDAVVSRLQIETLFGNPANVASNAAEALNLRRKGDSFSHPVPDILAVIGSGILRFRQSFSPVFRAIPANGGVSS